MLFAKYLFSTIASRKSTLPSRLMSPYCKDSMVVVTVVVVVSIGFAVVVVITVVVVGFAVVVVVTVVVVGVVVVVVTVVVVI